MRAQVLPLADADFEAMVAAIAPVAEIDHRKRTSSADWTAALDAADRLLAIVTAAGITEVRFNDPIGPVIPLGEESTRIASVIAENHRGRTMISNGADLGSFSQTCLDSSLAIALVACSGLRRAPRIDVAKLPAPWPANLAELARTDGVHGFKTLRSGHRTWPDSMTRLHFRPAAALGDLPSELAEIAGDRGLAVVLYADRYK